MFHTRKKVLIILMLYEGDIGQYYSFIRYKFSIPLHNQMNTLDNELNNEFQISGREMFEFNPDLVGEDDDEATEGVIERERDSDDEVKHRERGRATKITFSTVCNCTLFWMLV